MQCRIHPEANGVNTCNQCGDWLCEGCTVDIQGRMFCRKCLAKLTAGTPDAYGPVSGPAAPYRPRRISGGLLFLFSFFLPPGANYMYMGLIKRGLAAMAGFFLIICLLSVFPVWPVTLILGLSIPVYYFACIFHGFNLRSRINAGEIVADSVDDISHFFKRNKRLIIGFIVLILCLTAAGGIIRLVVLPFLRYLPLIVIIIGLCVLFKKPGGGGKKGNKEE